MTTRPKVMAIRCERFARLQWPRDEQGISDYANPAVIPLATPRIEWVFPPIDRRTHKILDGDQ